MEGEELAKHGPAKQPEKQGLDEYSEAPVEKGPFYTADPTGRRTGNGGMALGCRLLGVALCACMCVGALFAAVILWLLCVCGVCMCVCVHVRVRGKDGL